MPNTKPLPESVARMIDDRSAMIPTCPLDDFILADKNDSKLAWDLDKGHLINLLDAAIERIEVLTRLVGEGTDQ